MRNNRPESGLKIAAVCGKNDVNISHIHSNVNNERFYLKFCHLLRKKCNQKNTKNTKQSAATDQNDVMENSRFHWSPHAVAEDVIHDNRSSGCCSNSAYVITGIASSFFVPIGIGQGLQPLVYFVAWNCVLGRTKFEMS